MPLSYQPQGVSLAFGCVSLSIVLHEIGHAIGLYHEHTRPDRDDYVDILYDNIRAFVERQFNKIPEGQSDTLGLGYDLQSIMHYHKDTFSKNGSDTIRPKDPTITSFGHSDKLSPLDIAKTNVLYSCDRGNFLNARVYTVYIYTCSLRSLYITPVI